LSVIDKSKELLQNFSGPINYSAKKYNIRTLNTDAESGRAQSQSQYYEHPAPYEIFTSFILQPYWKVSKSNPQGCVSNRNPPYIALQL
jgi:hypothetical protein